MYRVAAVILLFFCGLFFNPLHAQPDTSSNDPSKKEKIAVDSSLNNQKDLVDVFKSLKKNKSNKAADTARKINKYHVTVVPAVGYTLTTGWAGIVAANVGFFTSDPERTNVSSVASPIIYTQYNQLTLPLLVNVWTKDNKYNIVAD